MTSTLMFTRKRILKSLVVHFTYPSRLMTNDFSYEMCLPVNLVLGNSNILTLQVKNKHKSK